MQESSRVVFIGSSIPPTERQLESGVPRDYEEFVAKYSATIKKQVSRYDGIQPEDVEDIVQTIIMQFVAGDYLQIYDAGRQSSYAEARYSKQLKKFEAGELDYRPVRHVGKFSSFMFEFVNRRLMGFRDRSNRYISKMRSLESFFDKDESSEGDVPQLSQYIGIPDAEFINIEVRQLLQRAFQHLVDNTNPTETRNFPELFTQIVNDAFMDTQNRFDRDSYAARKLITPSAVSMQLRELRSHLEKCGLYKNLKQLGAARDKQNDSAVL